MSTRGSNLKDRVGQKFGRLTVISLAVNGERGGVRWLCRCECGNERIVLAYNLANGNTKSCGCFQPIDSLAANFLVKHGHASAKNQSKVYQAWNSMRNRCTNPRCAKWDIYGGRGIAVCDLWIHSFPQFLAYVGEPPTPRHSIDRINVNGNYEPGNVKWSTPKEQRHNQRKPVRCSLKK